MNESMWIDGNEEANDKPLPKQLREMYEKEKEKREALETQLKGLTSRVRKTELSKVFAEKGIPEEAVDLFPSDVDPTGEAVNDWVSKYGALFSQGTKEPEPKPEVTTPVVNTETVEALNAIHTMTETGTPANGPKDYSKQIFDDNFCDEVPFDEFKSWLDSHKR